MLLWAAELDWRAACISQGACLLERHHEDALGGPHRGRPPGSALHHRLRIGLRTREADYPTYPSQRGGVYRGGGYNDPRTRAATTTGIGRDSRRRATATATTCAAKGSIATAIGATTAATARAISGGRSTATASPTGYDEGYRNARYQGRRYPAAVLRQVGPG